MALRKVAPTTQWPTSRRGKAPKSLPLVLDAGADQYYIEEDASIDADAFLVLDSGNGQYTVDTTRTGTRAKIIKAGPVQSRIIE